jgi:hypothetical protein
MGIRRFLLDLYHMRYALTRTCTPNSCALHRKQQSVMLFLINFVKMPVHVWCHLRLKTKVVEFYAVCLLYIDRNTVIEQIILLFRTYSYKWKQFVALPYCVTLQTTEIGFRY